MTINSFQGEYRFLSNFWYIAGGVSLDDENNIRLYPTVEHAYQAAKSLDMNDRRAILRIGTPGDAKRYSKTIQLRSDWESLKFSIMLSLLRQKFSYSHLANKLLETGNEELIEGNTWHDNIWGVCMCHNCTMRYGDTAEPGNMLGKLLMQVRDELRHETKSRD